MTKLVLLQSNAWTVTFFFNISGLTKTILVSSDLRTLSVFAAVNTSAPNPRFTMLAAKLSFILLSADKNKHFGKSGSPRLWVLLRSSTKYGNRQGGSVLPLFVDSAIIYLHLCASNRNALATCKENILSLAKVVQHFPLVWVQITDPWARWEHRKNTINAQINIKVRYLLHQFWKWIQYIVNILG